MRFLKGLVDIIILVLTWSNLLLNNEPESRGHIAIFCCGYYTCSLVAWLDARLNWK